MILSSQQNTSFPFYFLERDREHAEITPISVTSGDPFNKHPAVYAIDRDLSTCAGTSTRNGRGWMKFEFGKTYFINKLVFHYWFLNNWFDPSAGCVQNLNAFKGCVDTDNNVDVSVYQGDLKQKSCGTLQLTYGLEQSDQIYTILCNAQGDIVKLSKNTGNIAFFEVVVISTGR